MIPTDKLLHFLVGGYVFALVQPVLGALAAALVVLVLAAAKEVYDYMNRDRHTPDPADLAATVAGALPFLLLQPLLESLGK